MRSRRAAHKPKAPPHDDKSGSPLNTVATADIHAFTTWPSRNAAHFFGLKKRFVIEKVYEKKRTVDEESSSGIQYLTVRVAP